MCGIIGYYGKQVINIDKFIKNTKHRGQDSTKYIKKDNAILGINRLAIVDISNGEQPLYNNDKTIALVGNGFIYNYESIMSNLSNMGIQFTTQNDFQVIPYLYQLYGLECVNYLEGMFAFCLYDSKDKIYLVCRDHIGKKPLYYLKDNYDYFFASESKAFLEVTNKLENIYELEPGSLLVINDQMKMIQKKYYNIPKMTQVVNPKHVRSLLEQAVKKRMRADVEVGTFLSGGIDSSIVTAIASQYQSNLKAITVGLKNSPDLINAKLVADHLGIEHIIVDFSVKQLIELIPKIIWHLESYNPSAINCALVNYLAAKKAKDNGISVILCGEGADEIFGGYLVLRDMDTKTFIESSWTMINNIHMTECKRLDRSTMAVTVEARCPFLDRNLVEYAINLPHSCKIKDINGRRVEKHILREACNDLLPEQVLWREKEPFDQGSGGRGIIDIINQQVSDEELNTIQMKYPNAKIIGKEMAYYYKIFRHLFGHIGGERQFDLYGNYPVMQNNICKRTSTSGS